MKQLLVAIVACICLSSCGIIHKLKTKHTVTSDSVSHLATMETVETHTTEKAAGTVPYSVSNVEWPVQPEDTTPVDIDTKDYHLHYMPPVGQKKGSIAVIGKTTAVPVTIDKTTDVTDTKAAKADTEVKRNDTLVVKDKKTNTIGVWVIIGIVAVVVIALLYWWVRRQYRNRAAATSLSSPTPQKQEP